jgi:hypothetical protein
LLDLSNRLANRVAMSDYVIKERGFRNCPRARGKKISAEFVAEWGRRTKPDRQKRREDKASAPVVWNLQKDLWVCTGNCNSKFGKSTGNREPTRALNQTRSGPSSLVPDKMYSLKLPP